MEFVGYSKLMAEYYSLQNKCSSTVTEAAEISHREQDLVHLLSEHYQANNTAHWNALYAPYFTEQETQLFAMKEGLMHVERPIKSMPVIQPNKYKARIKDLETRLKSTEDPEEIEQIQTQMKAYGWDPSLEFNESNQEIAKRRILDHYNDELKGFYFIDVTTEVQKMLEYGKIEFSEYGEAVPLNLLIAPCGCFMKYGDLSEASLDIAHEYGITEGSIYNFFALSFNCENFQKAYESFEAGYPFTTFDVPSNVYAARMAKMVYEYCDLSLDGKTPVLKKLYEDQFNKDMISKVNQFNHFVNESNIHCYSEISHESMAIPAEAFYSINLLNDQLSH